MAESCVQERFDCERCNRMLVRIDVTGPAPYEILSLFYQTLTQPVRAALRLCDACTEIVATEAIEETAALLSDASQ